METYINQIQNKFVQYIATRQIMELCEEAEQWPVARVPKRWWEQDGINLSGPQAAATTSACMEETEGTARGETDD